MDKKKPVMKRFGDYKSVGRTEVILPDGHGLCPIEALAMVLSLPPNTVLDLRESDADTSDNL